MLIGNAEEKPLMRINEYNQIDIRRQCCYTSNRRLKSIFHSKIAMVYLINFKTIFET